MARGRRKNTLSVRAAGYALLVAFSIFLGLAWLLFDHVRGAPRAAQRAAAAWTAVPCVVLESGVVTESFSATRGSTRGSAGYAPRARYRYVVDGRAYVGDRFWFATTYFNTHEDASRVAAPYITGTAHTCHVDPSNPGISVLARDVLDTRSGWLWTVLFGMVGLAGIAGALFLIVKGDTLEERPTP